MTGFLRLTAGLLLCFAALVLAPAASAMTVSTTADDPTQGNGACSLREAIVAAGAGSNSADCGPAGSPPIVVSVPQGTYQLGAPGGQLAVGAGANIEVIGANPNGPALTTIESTVPTRVLEVAAGAQVKLQALRIQGGYTANGTDAISYPNYGGSADNGGGILNKGGLTLDRVIVTENFTGHGGRGSDGGYDIQHDAKGGGGGGSGGGIYNSAGASLSVTASTISDNGTGGGGDGGNGSIGVGGAGHYPYGGQGGNGGPPGYGGGIFNAGSASITTSTISGNFTGRGGNGGNGGQGAGPFNDGMGHTFSAGRGGYGGDGGSASYSRDGYCQCYMLNSALGGGGIANVQGGSLTMTASTVSGNNTGAGGNGGGAGVGGLESGHSVTGSGGGFAGSGGVGGGLFNSFGTATITNVTFSGNFTGDGGIGGNGPTSGSLGPGPGGYGGNGGAIWANGKNSSYTVQLTHVTISKNSLGNGGPAGAPGAPPEGSGPFPGTPGVRGKGSGIATGGRYDTSGASVYLKNTVIANNGLVSDANCVDSGAAPTNFFDQGGNVTWGGTTCPGTSADPMLGLLQNNGGPTETMRPEAGSAAIGLVPLAACTVLKDQRGFSRPGGDSLCDAGAVESDAAAPGQTPTSTALASAANPSVPGQAVKYTASVSPQPSGGTVAFTDAGSPISGCEAVPIGPGGQAFCTVTYSVVGSHPIKASYSGNGLFTASSSTLTEVVQNAQEPSNPGGGGGGGGGASTGPPPAGGSPPTSPAKKALSCPKGKKRVVRNGKARCVPKKKPHKKGKGH